MKAWASPAMSENKILSELFIYNYQKIINKSQQL